MCRYEKELVAPEIQSLGDDLLRRFHLTEQLMLQIMKHSGLLSSSSTAFLQQKLQLRAPYVAPLNILQVGVWGGVGWGACVVCVGG